MSDVVLDANVLIGFVDPGDVHHQRATDVLREIEKAGASVVLLAFVVEEALAVLVRRKRERRGSTTPDLNAFLGMVRAWQEAGLVDEMVAELAGRLPDLLDIVEESHGALNPNDAKLVLLQRTGAIGTIVTFDRNLAEFPALQSWQP